MKNLLSEETIKGEYHTITIRRGIIHLHIEPIEPEAVCIEKAIQEVRVLCSACKPLILIDPMEAKVLNKAHRLTLIQALNEFATAVAILNTGFIASLMIHFMMKIDKPIFSMRAFATEGEAEKWLNSFKGGENE